MRMHTRDTPAGHMAQLTHPHSRVVDSPDSSATKPGPMTSRRSKRAAAASLGDGLVVEEGRRPSRVQEEDPRPRLEGALPHELQQAGGALARVDGVEQDALELGEGLDGGSHLRRRQRVAGAHLRVDDHHVLLGRLVAKQLRALLVLRLDPALLLRGVEADRDAIHLRLVAAGAQAGEHPGMGASRAGAEHDRVEGAARLARLLDD
mmetsp:Transcript_45725/g.151600  ORF Transcript_45725/g.151600 Transcript_45725/m.151600 type:complete len:206 (+) Transcript_45725:48-665(+)